MFELSLSVDGNKKGSIKLQKFGTEKIPNLKRGIDKATYRLNNTIKKKKLSGQVLNVRSGLLRASFKTSPARYEAGVGVYGQVGTNVKYARIHEYGGVIKPKPPNQWLRFKTADGSWHTVAEVTMPARPYAVPAMHEETNRMAKDIITEVMRPLR